MILTELIYQLDSYVQEFTAKVREVNSEENYVILNRTAFYPGGGGQPADHGILTGERTYIVKGTKKVGEDVHHYIEGDVPNVGENLVGKIDWTHRYQLMRTHTALHILSGVIWRDYGIQVTGANMENLKGRMDFEFEQLNENLIKEIEQKVNLEIERGRNITVEILPREEAMQIPDLIRTKINLLPQGISEIRTVNIEGLDLQADGGTHVRNTKEVGRFKIVKYQSKGKLYKRVYIELDE